MLERLKRFYYSFYLRYGGAQVKETIQGHGFFNGVRSGLFCGKSIWIEDGVKINVGNNSKLIIGDYFYVNSYSIIDCQHKITIGSRVQIGPHCYIGDFDHDIRVDIRRTFHHRGDKNHAPIIIDDNVWIGAGVIILKGVTIGKNSVIGAGSVVINDIPANVVAVGIPAKKVKDVTGNFDEDNI